jgi:tRNA pseudouridine38-40 synthase
MPRYSICLEYDGTPFSGWQRQASDLSVQAVIEDAIFKFSGEHVTIRAAGRTDAGVHALGQVAHLVLTKDWEPGRVRDALNFHMRPHPVVVLQCAHVSDAFDARFSAIERRYLYRILTRRAPPVLDRNRVWWLPIELNADAMSDAARVFIGHHDFTTFRATQCQSPTAMKTLTHFEVQRLADEIHLTVASRSFLHNQVRSMVGSLKHVGEGKWTKSDLETALAARNRTACGTVAPANGLYLAEVKYPADIQPRW